MKKMRPMLGLLTLLLLVGMCWLPPSTSHAQLRTIPASAKRATTGELKPMPYVVLNGKPVRLAPGALILDQNNRSIVQGALPRGSDVAVVTDTHGDISRIYILTPVEKTQFDRRK